MAPLGAPEKRSLSPQDEDADIDCEEEVLVLQSRDQETGKKRSSDAAYKLARSLLAYKANQVAGAYVCQSAADAAVEAQTVLFNLGFEGEGEYLYGKGKLTPEEQLAVQEVLDLHGTLDAYNNNDILDCSL